MAKNRLNHPIVNKDLEFVLRVIPVPDDVRPNFDNKPEWVENIDGGIVRTTDFEKAKRFKGSWLNETVWTWNLYYQPVNYIEAKNEWTILRAAAKTVARKSKGARRAVERLQIDKRSIRNRAERSSRRVVRRKQAAKHRKRIR